MSLKGPLPLTHRNTFKTIYCHYHPFSLKRNSERKYPVQNRTNIIAELGWVNY